MSITTPLILLLLLAAAIKLLLNFAFPFILIKINRDRGVSYFPFIEFLPLAMSAVVAALSSSPPVSALSIMAWGTSLILVSYAHIVVVLYINYWLRGAPDNRDEFQ